MKIGIKQFLLRLCLALPVVLLSHGALAIDLHTAKAQGLVGEMTTGYLGATKPATPEVKSLIADINGQRKARYQQVAQKVGKPLQVIEQLAGEKAIKKTQPGNYVQTPDGRWIKK